MDVYARLVSPTQQILNSVLEVRLREEEDFGLYTCRVGNASTDFSLHNISKTTGPRMVLHILCSPSTVGLMYVEQSLKMIRRK